MKSYLSLFAVLFAASVGAEVININDKVDQSFEKNNDLIRKGGRSILPFHASGIVGKVTFTKGEIIGIDSEVRTGNCTITVEDGTVAVDIHFGFSLLGVVFQDLKVNGDEMSAFLRIRGNSIQYAYTIHNATECHVTLDAFQFEKMEKAELAASRPKYDGLDVSEYVRSTLLPKVNFYLTAISKKVEKQLQKICHKPNSLLSELPDVLLQVYA